MTAVAGNGQCQASARIGIVAGVPLAGAPHLDSRPGSLDALRVLADRYDVVMLDLDQVPTEYIDALHVVGCTVRPCAESLRVAQDRLLTRQALEYAGFEIAPFMAVEGSDSNAVSAFVEQWGWPIVMKPRHSGDDGAGIHTLHDLDAVGDLLASRSPESWVLEAHLPIACELTVLVARNPSGYTATYPVIETHQHDRMGRESVMPARVPDHVANAARQMAKSVADGIDATGVLAVALFLTTTGDLVVDELAIGPQHSGLATMEATVTSQFHNHLRGILDWSLGSTEMVARAAATVSLCGPASGTDLSLDLPAARSVPSAQVHLYAEHTDPGHPFGHVTALGADHAEALVNARAAARLLLGE